MLQTSTEGIRDAVMGVDGIGRVDRELVWDPAWHAGMIANGAWDDDRRSMDHQTEKESG